MFFFVPGSRRSARDGSRSIDGLAVLSPARRHELDMDAVPREVRGCAELLDVVARPGPRQPWRSVWCSPMRACEAAAAVADWRHAERSLAALGHTSVLGDLADV